MMRDVGQTVAILLVLGSGTLIPGSAVTPSTSIVTEVNISSLLAENVTDAVKNVNSMAENVTDPVANFTIMAENVTNAVENDTYSVENVTYSVENITSTVDNVTSIFENVADLVKNATGAGENVTYSAENVTETADLENTTSSADYPNVLGAKWAACFEKLNMSKPTASFTCNTYLLMHRSFKEFWTQHSAVEMCKHREAYGELMECVLQASKGCFPPENLLHMPDNGKARVGFNYICGVGMAKQYGVNVTCAQIQFREVFECVYRDVKLATGRDSLPIPIWPKLMCRTYDIADLCSWEKMQVCGRQTAGAYTRMMSLYLRPPSCNGNSASSVKVTDNLVFLLLLLSFLICSSSWAFFYR